LCVFFFQAEDGIRDDLVTGVQTCALPIYGTEHALVGQVVLEDPQAGEAGVPLDQGQLIEVRLGADEVEQLVVLLVRHNQQRAARSEERRVGKEGSTQWRVDSRSRNWLRGE